MPIRFVKIGLIIFITYILISPLSVLISEDQRVPFKIDEDLGSEELSFVKDVIKLLQSGATWQLYSKLHPEAKRSASYSDLISILKTYSQNLKYPNEFHYISSQVTRGNGIKYVVNFETKINGKYIVFTMDLIQEQSHQPFSLSYMHLSHLADSIRTSSLMQNVDFGLKHYSILVFYLLCAAFILIVSYKSLLYDDEWISVLWLIGFVVGFSKVFINLTTGAIDFNVLNIQIPIINLMYKGGYSDWVMSVAAPFLPFIYYLNRIKKY